MEDMAGFLVWAFSAIAVAVGLMLAWALSGADPIGRFLRRRPWPEPKMAGWSRNEAGSGPGISSPPRRSAANPTPRVQFRLDHRLKCDGVLG